jgi:hypothetical protein
VCVWVWVFFFFRQKKKKRVRERIEETIIYLCECMLIKYGVEILQIENSFIKKGVYFYFQQGLSKKIHIYYLFQKRKSTNR